MRLACGELSRRKGVAVDGGKDEFIVVKFQSAANTAIETMVDVLLLAEHGTCPATGCLEKYNICYTFGVKCCGELVPARVCLYIVM